jgi:hypothetical protein
MDEKTFITPGHVRVRNRLRFFGPIIFGFGLLLTIISAASIIADSGSFTPDHYGWLGFVGLPLMFVGGVCSMYGYMGAMTRYAMSEGAPPMKDTFNYLADGTQEGMTKTGRALASGIREGLTAPSTHVCPRCQAANEADSKFCKSCGSPI